MAVNQIRHIPQNATAHKVVYGISCTGTDSNAHENQEEHAQKKQKKEIMVLGKSKTHRGIKAK